MMAQLPWTGWNKNKNVELPLLQLLLQHSGRDIVSISLTLQDTSTSQLKCQDHLEYLMVLSPSSMLKQGLNHKLKPYGVKLRNIKFQELYTSIKWIKLVLISNTQSNPSIIV